ncbi:transposase [Cucumis melo var. makuwa]|uniref:Transposase n=1 Tax=Cucumis melo var. makuwa TaxID=1194695 RepID=A0A5D3CTR1_CUCMM|nr:transposase [Cucumis melo var. makuwa]
MGWRLAAWEDELARAMRMTQVARMRSSDLRLEATQLITPWIRRTTEEEAICTLTDSDDNSGCQEALVEMIIADELPFKFVDGLDAHIDFDSNEDAGEDFFYDTIVEEFEDDATTPFEQGSSEIDIYLLEANVRTEVSESAFNTGGTAQTVDALICIQNWLNSDPIDLQVQHELEDA